MNNNTSPDDIRRLLRQGQREQARKLLDSELASTPDHPEYLYLRGMLHAQSGANQAAISDFNAVLRLAPDLPPALFNRGLVLYRVERMGEALEDFLALSRIHPGNPDVWTNIGIIHAREGRPAEAIQSLGKASALAPDSPILLRTMGNALRDLGQYREALNLLRKTLVLTPDDPATLIDYALTLLSDGGHDEAHAYYQRALAIDPGDQTALAGLYITSNERGDKAAAARLMDYRKLLSCRSLGLLEEMSLESLREVVLAHDQLIWEPAGRSTRVGKQSPMLDLSEGSRFHHFQQMIMRQVQQRIHVLASDSQLQGHPWLAARPDRWRIQSWVTILDQGGHQTPHIHPAGWLSGVFYVDAGNPDVEQAGDLVFGRAQSELPLSQAAREHHHRPMNGQLVMFPSYFFHNTVPYSGTRPRISLAFDVIPDRD